MKSAIREILETIVLTIIIFLLVRAVVQNFKVEGRSMEPTLQTGQLLLVNKAAYWRIDVESAASFVPGLDPQEDEIRYVFGPPQRGDVIVFMYPRDLSRDFIKRVIAVPGDIVEIKEGKVFVNDQPVQEDYLLAQPNYYVQRQMVPENNFFVLGDNRNNSLDSHVWGNVPGDNIIGKAWIRYWPVDKWGLIPTSQIAAEGAR